jgi:hypothetical protein
LRRGAGDLVEQCELGGGLEDAAQRGQRLLILFVEWLGQVVHLLQQGAKFIDFRIELRDERLQRIGLGLIAGHLHAGEALIGGAQLLQHVDRRRRSREDPL